jgi:hypothetical protein
MTQAASTLPKNAADHIPFCKDQGIPNLVGSSKRGESIQHICTTMPADGIIVFATFGLSNMANGNYAVIVTNHTDPADQATCARVARLTDKFTLAGADAADELDILVIGQLAGQLDS